MSGAAAGALIASFWAKLHALPSTKSLEAMILHMLDCRTRDARSGPAHLDVSGLEIDDRDPLAPSSST